MKLGNKCVVFTDLLKFFTIHPESLSPPVRLTDVVCVTLVKIRKALKGQIAMSTELKSIFNSMLVGKVPAMWAAKSYTSFNHMWSYMTDLLAMQATVSTSKIYDCCESPRP